MTHDTTASSSPKPSPGFHSTAQEAAIGLLRAADAVRQHFQETLNPHGVTLQQYNVLRILRGAGEPGLPALQIADRLMERSPGITRLIDGLERKGWVRRRRCTEDRRVVHNHITPTALRLLAELDGPIERADKEAVAALTPSQQAQLAELLRRLVAD